MTTAPIAEPAETPVRPTLVTLDHHEATPTTEGATGPLSSPDPQKTKTRLSCYSDGCDHPECRQAHTDAKRQRKRQQSRPDGIAPPATVPAGTVRTHIAELRKAGLGIGTIADRAGITPQHLQRIVSGETKRITPATKDRLLGVMASSLAPGAFVPAAETLMQLDVLLADGWTRKGIAKAAGLPFSTIRSIIPTRETVRYRTAEAVGRLYAREFPADVDLTSGDPLDDLRIFLEDLGSQKWRDDAECRRLDAPSIRDRVNIFYPGRGDSLDAARAVCARCPVQVECLDYAVKTRSLEGVWGSTSGAERRDIRHEQIVQMRQERAEREAAKAAARAQAS